MNKSLNALFFFPLFYVSFTLSVHDFYYVIGQLSRYWPIAF